MIKSIFYWLIIVLFLVPLLFSCNRTEAIDMQNVQKINFNWLVGIWSNTEDSVLSTEEWVKVNDSLYKGIGVSVYLGDTVFHEKIVIKREGEEVYFIPDVAGEIDKETSRFRLTSQIDGKNYIFENQDHDFPQKIVYRLINKDSIFATVEGLKNGKYQQIKFPFNRIK
jgi:hypothetical protein